MQWVRPKTKAKIQEMIGRVRTVITNLYSRRPIRATTDLTRPDYAFFDQAQHGILPGLELAGLMLKPIKSKIAAWVLGILPQATCKNERSDAALNKWLQANHSGILEAYENAVNLGDFYLVVNPDMSLTQVTPDIVFPIVAEDDYSKVVGWRFTYRHNHPTEIGRYQVITDDFYPDRRERKVESDTGTTLQTFPNLIGRVPIVHVVNNRQPNSLFGLPEGYSLAASRYGLLYRYQEILEAGLDGNIKQGRPTPVLNLNDSAAVKQFIDQNSNRVRVDTDENGEAVYEDQVTFDSDKLLILAGKFQYAQPGAFAGETVILLNVLYWLMIEHLELPEFVMGTAIESSKASTETQMPIFVKWVEKKRGQVEGWFLDLCEIVLAMMQLPFDTIRLNWADLVGEDMQLKLEVVRWAYSEGLIDKKTALSLAPVQIEDIDAVLKSAEQAPTAEERFLAVRRQLAQTGSDE